MKISRKNKASNKSKEFSIVPSINKIWRSLLSRFLVKLIQHPGSIYYSGISAIMRSIVIKKQCSLFLSTSTPMSILSRKYRIRLPIRNYWRLWLNLNHWLGIRMLSMGEVDRVIILFLLFLKRDIVSTTSSQIKSKPSSPTTPTHSNSTNTTDPSLNIYQLLSAKKYQTTPQIHKSSIT